MSTPAPEQTDIDSAYESYLERFDSLYSDRAEGSFVKFGHTLIQKLGRREFEERLSQFVAIRGKCKSMLESGATISDSITLDFQEAAAWLAVEAPNLLDLFQGEMGDLPASTFG